MCHLQWQRTVINLSQCGEWFRKLPILLRNEVSGLILEDWTLKDEQKTDDGHSTETSTEDIPV